MEEIEIGSYRTIPAGIRVWSTSNQEQIRFDKDIIVEVGNFVHDSDYAFVKPKQLLFNLPGFFPLSFQKELMNMAFL